MSLCSFIGVIGKTFAHETLPFSHLILMAPPSLTAFNTYIIKICLSFSNVNSKRSCDLFIPERIKKFESQTKGHPSFYKRKVWMTFTAKTVKVSKNEFELKFCKIGYVNIFPTFTLSCSWEECHFPLSLFWKVMNDVERCDGLTDVTVHGCGSN